MFLNINDAIHRQYVETCHANSLWKECYDQLEEENWLLYEELKLAMFCFNTLLITVIIYIIYNQFIKD